MNKVVLTVCAVLVMCSFAVTGAMAQGWEWSQPVVITPAVGEESLPPMVSTPAAAGEGYIDIEFYPNYTAISGSVDESIYEPLTLGETVESTLMFSDDTISANGIKSVLAPPVGFEYIIDADTVALVADKDEVALYPQPIIPTVDGEFTSIAAGPDGELYILFDADDGTQYLLQGTSLDMEEVTIRFTPRKLNLGSKGKWVSCKIQDLPEDYLPADIDLDTLCIVAVNGVFLAEEGGPICAKDSGWPAKSNGKKKVKIKFDRRNLADFITDYPGLDPALADITVIGSTLDGLQFYGEDVVKVKPAKIKKIK
jgi:hypothetical protein